MLTGLVLALLLSPLPAVAQDDPPVGDEESEQAEPSEEAEEAEPAEPAEEAEPAEPAEPAEEAEPAEPAEPIQEVQALPPKKPVEEIIVTGTRIGRSNLEEFAHITVLSAKDIQMSGVTTIDDLLNKMPSMTLQGINKQTNNGGNGLAFVDLRNLGVGRTLVLVNGRRFVKSGESGGGVDMNNIPVQMIERIEVLLDGASAIYGSDAIGGVINIILKEDFEGLLLDASSGITSKGDGAEVTVSSTMGANSDRGNITANISYMHRNEIRQKDRDWAREPIAGDYFDDDGSVVQIMGSSTHRASHVIATDVNGETLNVVFEPDPSTGRSFSNWDDSVHRYNYGGPQWLVGRMERFHATLLGNYEITENAKAYMEGTYTNRWSRNQLAPQPLGLGGGTAVFPGMLAVPLSNPHIPQDFRDLVDPDSGFVYLMRRMGQVGNRVYDNEANTFRVVFGVKADFSESFSGDLHINYGQNSNKSIIHNSVNLARVWETLDPAVCAQNANRGCVVGNYFGDTALQPEVLHYIRYKDQTSTSWDMLSLAGSVTGELFNLPGGAFAIAVGGEARWEAGYNFPDATVAGGDSGGNLQDPTAGDYNAQEVFGEISLPLLKDLPAVADLTIDLASRFSHYNTFGQKLTYRTGLSWAPVSSLRLRGIFSTAFRAPSISDLYGGSMDSYESVSDPCNDWQSSDNPTLQANCQSQGVPPDFDQNIFGGSQIRTNIGGNPELESETAKVFNTGMVFTPTFLPSVLKGFSLTFDFYHITVDNAISSLDTKDILNSCYQSQNMSHPYCQFIGARDANGVIQSMVATLQNINQLKTMGFDFTVNYGFPLSMIGMTKSLRLDMGLHGNYLLKYTQINTEVNEESEFAGTISEGGGSYAHMRWIARLALSGRSWSFANRVRYIGAADVFGADETYPTAAMPAVAYWDLVGSYMWNNFTFIAGLDNVLNTDPPFMPGTGQNANVQTYDFMGTYLYGRIAYKF